MACISPSTLRAPTLGNVIGYVQNCIDVTVPGEAVKLHTSDIATPGVIWVKRYVNPPLRLPVCATKSSWY
jgi:hypothetical protein